MCFMCAAGGGPPRRVIEWLVMSAQQSAQRRRKRKADGDKWKLNLPCNFLLSRHQRHWEKKVYNISRCAIRQFDRRNIAVLHIYELCDCSVIIMHGTDVYNKNIQQVVAKFEICFYSSYISWRTFHNHKFLLKLIVIVEKVTQHFNANVFYIVWDKTPLLTFLAFMHLEPF